MADLRQIENTVDVHCVDDFLPHMPEVRGRQALGQRLARRLSCPRGQIPWLPNDGTDLRALLLSKAPHSSLADAARAECLRDEQVEDVTVVVDGVRTANGGEQLDLRLIVEDAEGPFELTLTISDAAVVLVRLESGA